MCSCKGKKNPILNFLVLHSITRRQTLLNKTVSECNFVKQSIRQYISQVGGRLQQKLKIINEITIRKKLKCSFEILYINILYINIYPRALSKIHIENSMF